MTPPPVVLLSQLSIGDSARVITLQQGEPAYRYKLLAMGLTPKTKLTVTRVAPLGDPIEIHVRGVALSLRKEEAALLQLERVC